MAFKAKHEELMTSRLLTSHPCTTSPHTSQRPTHHPLRSRPLGAILATFLTTSLALGSIACTTGAAVARSIYDGPWSVLILTASGSCEPSYRYGVLINDGVVTYDGIAPISLQGRVTPKGMVRVIVQGGGQYADGAGKLTRNRGVGIWRGQAMGSTCAGTWQAERRDN
jgi:hypothetical protein